jgi:hypothetical protein
MSDKPKAVARWTGAYITAHDHGGFVAYGDYLELERELAAARADAAHNAALVEQAERDIKKMTGDIYAALARVAELERDAGRYLWLRLNYASVGFVGVMVSWDQPEAPQALDAAIDAAMDAK